MSQKPSRLSEFYKTSAAYKARPSMWDPERFKSYTDLVSAHVPPRSRLLDVGCGVGLSSQLLSRAGYQVAGADFSFLFLEGANERKGNEKVDYICADSIKLPFTADSFDAVCGHEFLEHVPDPDKALSEMNRVLRPGGILILMGPNLLCPWIPLEIAIRPQHLTYSFRNPISAGSRPGNVILGAKNLLLLGLKKIYPSVFYLYRDPFLDFEGDDVGADRDAVYFLNPVDLKKWLKRAGYKLLFQAPFRGHNPVIRIACRLLPESVPETTIVAKKQSSK